MGSVEKIKPQGMTAVNNSIRTAQLKGKYLYEVLFGTKPTGIDLPIWDSACYAHLQKTKRTNHKLIELAIESKLLGIIDSSKDYQLLGIKENMYLIV
ncbi:Hypothetical protein PHPALM_17150 [Phytophthora palmivora]|uniref:Uncharacterized protein n=1 Tax=Phytophthora palmivora TaxID=4796 RepID=A0A2P4XMY0_9STRA|nr:Hypothetical protein PHPALM_17150 [Phytophthora palmivora]